MDSLPKDVLVYMAVKMDIKDALSLCRTSSFFYNTIYKNDDFWMNKSKKDFSFLDSSVEIYRKRYLSGKRCKYVITRGKYAGEKCHSYVAANNFRTGQSGEYQYCSNCLKKSGNIQRARNTIKQLYLSN